MWTKEEWQPVKGPRAPGLEHDMAGGPKAAGVFCTQGGLDLVF